MICGLCINDVLSSVVRRGGLVAVPRGGLRVMRAKRATMDVAAIGEKE